MSEREGSLVKMTEMDEPLFYRRSQNCVPSTEDERYTASPGCERRHGQKVRKGTREVLAGIVGDVDMAGEEESPRIISMALSVYTLTIGHVGFRQHMMCIRKAV